MKKSLIYLVAFATLLSLFPVVNLNFASAQESCDPDALRPVSYGQRGAAVKNLQACLMEAGYEIPAGATGYYGSQTAAAVLQFYRDQGNETGVALRGRRFGPQGIAALKETLASTEEPSEAQTPGEEQTPQGTEGTTPSQQQNQLASLLPLILALTGVQLDATQTAALSQALANNDMTTAMTIILQARGRGDQQQQTGEEGFLNAEKDPSVGIVTVREGETGRVAGIRFRADNGAVSVRSLFLRWTGSIAPYRVISALALKDSAGNVLYQTNVTNSTFLQDSSLNYYLPVSGLNVNVPKNGYASIFVEVTIVGTLPSGVTNAGFEIRGGDVRGVDGAGVDRFAPSSPLPWSFNLQQALAGSAYFIGAVNPNTPREGYVVASDVNNKNIYGARLMTFDLTAKNDNLRLTQITGYVTGTAQVTAVSLRQGSTVLDQQTPDGSGAFTFNLAPSNFVVNRDQTVSFDVLADLANAASTSVATVTVTIATTTGQNSLGDPVSKYVNLTSNMMHWVLVGPQFSVADKSISVTKDQNNSTTTVSSVVYKVKVKALNGPVYISTTNVATITVETTGGATSIANVVPTEVRDQAGNLVSSSGGYYQVPEGSEYTFEFRTSGQTFAGVQSVRARLSSLAWDTDINSYPLDTASFLHNNPDFITNFVSPQ